MKVSLVDMSQAMPSVLVTTLPKPAIKVNSFPPRKGNKNLVDVSIYLKTN